MRHTLSSLALLAPLVAQPLVTPADYASVFGNQTVISLLGQYPQNTFQQIHADLGTVPRAFGQLAFRQSYANVQAVARSVDLELLVGDSDFRLRSRTFASNFRSPPVLAIARRRVSLPDHTGNPAGGYPGPFDAVLPFDNVYVFLGTADLAWQVTAFDDSTTQQGRAAYYPLDGFRYDEGATAANNEYGTGCIPTGRFTPMRGSQLTRSFWFPQPTVSLQLGTAQATRNAPIVVQLGTAAANVAIPGLCGPLLVGQVAAEVYGATDPAGTFAASPFTFAFAPRYVGLRLYTQAITFESRGAELPFCLSTGASFTVPALPRRPANVASVFATGVAAPVAGQLDDYRGVIVELR
jgi:hypothetical protein